MKILAAFILMTGAACFGQDASGITNKVTEIDRDKDGKIDVRIEMIYRGESRLMMTTSRRNQQGVMTVQMRGYNAGGKMVMVESDEDGDGTLESITVFGKNNSDFEMFTRESDGTVKPLSPEKLDSLKRQVAVANSSMRELFAKPDMSEDDMQRLLERNRQKIEAIKRESKNDGD